MTQEMQSVFEVEARKAAVGSTPDPEVAALPKRRQFSAAYKRPRVILDVFSRYEVGCMMALREWAELAHELIATICDK